MGRKESEERELEILVDDAIVAVNVPTVSFGLTMGWVSLASGEGGGEGEADDADMARVVLAAGTTFLSALAAVPLAARALHAGRKFTVIATSLVFAVSEQLEPVYCELVLRLGDDNGEFAGVLGAEAGGRRVVGGGRAGACRYGRHGGLGSHSGACARDVCAADSRRRSLLARARA